MLAHKKRENKKMKKPAVFAVKQLIAGFFHWAFFTAPLIDQLFIVLSESFLLHEDNCSAHCKDSDNCEHYYGSVAGLRLSLRLGYRSGRAN